MVNTKVASATDGAAPKIPAKLFGRTMSPRAAKKETTAPPIRNLSIRSIQLSNKEEAHREATLVLSLVGQRLCSYSPWRKLGRELVRLPGFPERCFHQWRCRCGRQFRTTLSRSSRQHRVRLLRDAPALRAPGLRRS